MGFLPALAILFTALKLIGIIAWSWWWVLAPVWIPLAIGLACFIVAGLIFVSAAVLNTRELHRGRAR